jgi:hypothetical protein
VLAEHALLFGRLSLVAAYPLLALIQLGELSCEQFLGALGIHWPFGRSR